MGPKYFYIMRNVLYVSSYLNSKLLRFHSVRPNLPTHIRPFCYSMLLKIQNYIHVQFNWNFKVLFYVGEDGVWTKSSKKSNVCIFRLPKFMPPTTASGRISVVGIIISRHSIQIHFDFFIQPISENIKLLLRHLKFLSND